MRYGPTSWNANPPEFVQYSAPSGPTARPLGDPPVSATVDLVPSGATRVSFLPISSVTITEPSSMATGPSGNRSPSASTRAFFMRRLLAELRRHDPDEVAEVVEP